MTKRQIEIFTGNSPLCTETVQLVKELACSSSEVQVYDLLQGQKHPIYLEKAKQYGVNAVPAIAMDGILVLIGLPNRAQLEAAGISQPYFATSGFLDFGMGI